jgi:hypothetical protein
MPSLREPLGLAAIVLDLSRQWHRLSHAEEPHCEVQKYDAPKNYAKDEKDDLWYIAGVRTFIPNNNCSRPPAGNHDAG